MNVSDLIDELQNSIDIYGDLPILLDDSEDTFSQIKVKHELYNNEPCTIIKGKYRI